MKKITVLFICVSSFLFLNGQNIIKNGGFEEYNTCPTEPSSMITQNSLKDWMSLSINKPAEYENFCGFFDRITNPPRAHSGNGRVSLLCYGYENYMWADGTVSFNDIRQYIQSKMVEKMQKDKIYFAQYFVSVGYNAEFIADYSLHFSPTLIPQQTNKRMDFSPLLLKPHITSDSIITRRLVWTEINGCYTAKGDEEYVVVGNFKTDDSTRHVKIGGDKEGIMAANFDDISVVQVDKFPNKDIVLCEKKDSINLINFCPMCQFKSANGDTSTAFVASNTGEFKFTATFDKCKFKKEFTVKVEDCVNYDVFVPNIFSPNEDGNNDVLQLGVPSVFEYQKLQIFDRWGRVLFTSKTKTEEWDGTFDGKQLNPGVFMYVFKYKDTRTGEEKTKVGDVTIIR
jgi:gliding motility-associated-like protein